MGWPGRSGRYGVGNRIDREAGRMSPTKKRQTMGKVTRERERRERREAKLEKKENKKLAAAEGPPVADVESDAPQE